MFDEFHNFYFVQLSMTTLQIQVEKDELWSGEDEQKSKRSRREATISTWRKIHNRVVETKKTSPFLFLLRVYEDW